MVVLPQGQRVEYLPGEQEDMHSNPHHSPKKLDVLVQPITPVLGKQRQVDP